MNRTTDVQVCKGGRQERVCTGTRKDYRAIAQKHNGEAWPWRVSWVSK